MITADLIAKYLDLKQGASDPYLPPIVDAVNSLVTRLPDINLKPDADDPSKLIWAADTVLGATMLGARLYTRRNSPNGIEAMSEAGATYVSRYDSDIARMLRIDGHELPRVG